MDGQTSDVVQPPAEDAPKAPAPPAKAHHSFMDIRLPKRPKKPEAKPAAASSDTPSEPVKQETAPAAKPEPAVASTAPAEAKPAPVPVAESAPEPTDDPAKKLDEANQKPKAIKPPKPPRKPGVTLAIVATIIIVLGLGALATYAYLATNGKAPF